MSNELDSLKKRHLESLEIIENLHKMNDRLSQELKDKEKEMQHLQGNPIHSLYSV